MKFDTIKCTSFSQRYDSCRVVIISHRSLIVLSSHELLMAASGFYQINLFIEKIWIKRMLCLWIHMASEDLPVLYPILDNFSKLESSSPIISTIFKVWVRKECLRYLYSMGIRLLRVSSDLKIAHHWLLTGQLTAVQLAEGVVEVDKLLCLFPCWKHKSREMRDPPISKRKWDERAVCSRK